jgi:hypothetical protein
MGLAKPLRRALKGEIQCWVSILAPLPQATAIEWTVDHAGLLKDWR